MRGVPGSDPNAPSLQGRGWGRATRRVVCASRTIRVARNAPQVLATRVWSVVRVDSILRRCAAADVDMHVQQFTLAGYRDGMYEHHGNLTCLQGTLADMCRHIRMPPISRSSIIDEETLRSWLLDSSVTIIDLQNKFRTPIYPLRERHCEWGFQRYMTAAGAMLAQCACKPIQFLTWEGGSSQAGTRRAPSEDTLSNDN